MPLLLLVRDGRNVVASNVRSFDVNEEAARQEWASAGRAILDFDERNRGAVSAYRVVRYEDLLDELESTMTEVLRCCDLDPDGFDFAAAAGAPVRGSSTVRRDGADVHWEPVAKDDAFRPNERWREWTPYQHARFAEVAGDVQRALGYPLGIRGASDRLGPVARRVDDTTWSAAAAPAPAPAAAHRDVTSGVRSDAERATSYPARLHRCLESGGEGSTDE